MKIPLFGNIHTHAHTHEVASRKFIILLEIQYLHAVTTKTSKYM